MVKKDQRSGKLTEGIVKDILTNSRPILMALRSAWKVVKSAELKKLLGHSKMKEWSVYIIRCRDRSLYTGFITDVQRRFGEYISGGRNLGSGRIWVTPIRSVSAVTMLF